jgi:uncharacterized protein with NRDE domain
MCLLVIDYKLSEQAPLMIAANREEFFGRPSLPPEIQSGSPRVLCGVDRRAGGTWLGVNEFGVVAAVTNRSKPSPPPAPRSRGLLCRDLLNFPKAADAAQYAYQQLASGAYAGANFVCLDRNQGAVIHAGSKLELIPLSPGRHLLTAGDVNDAKDARQTLASELFNAAGSRTPQEFVAAAKRVCAHYAEPEAASIIIRRRDRGTVSSSILVLADRAATSHFLFAPGPPDKTSYEDLSRLLRELNDSGL